MVDLPPLYNGILGRPALAKFMAASHYAYNTLKMSGTVGVITIPLDKKDAIICMDKMYRDAVAAEAMATVVPTKEDRGKKKGSRDAGKVSGKRVSSECAVSVGDLSESSNSEKSKITSSQVKKVSTGLAGVDGTFTISATLDDK